MSRPRDLLIAAALVAVTFALFAQVRQFEFTSYDDPDYVTANPHVRQGVSADGVRWAMTSNLGGNWHPLTMLSHMLDVELFGVRGGPHHLINVVLHAANVALLYALLRMMTGARWPSVFVAALFAVHPLHVESVAWVAERKDVLSTLFFLLTLIAYVKYVRAPAEQAGRRRGWFIASLVVFALGLMSKAMLVTVPGVLLLVDCWPLKRQARWKNLLVEKVPFVVMAVGVSVVTFALQRQSGAVRSLEAVPFSLRLQNAIVSYADYLVKMMWPANLAVMYPFPASIPIGVTIAAAVLLIAITWLAWRVRRRRPYVIVGWLWYLGTLLPVIGIVQVGQQALADRYTYIPLIGVFVAISFLVAEWSQRSRARVQATSIAAAVVLALLMWRTNTQLATWRNSETLWTHATSVTRNNWVAWNHLATVYSDQRRFDEALKLTAAVIELRPDYAIGYLNHGNTLMRAGQPAAAVGSFERAVALRPELAAAHNNLGILLISAGRTTEAVAHFRAAAEAEPNVTDWQKNLAAAELRLAQEKDSPATQPSAK